MRITVTVRIRTDQDEHPDGAEYGMSLEWTDPGGMPFRSDHSQQVAYRESARLSLDCVSELVRRVLKT